VILTPLWGLCCFFPEAADKIVDAVRAKIEIAGLALDTTVKSDSKAVVFETDLPVGKTKLISYLY